jgi:hypothetical protein
VFFLRSDDLGSMTRLEEMDPNGGQPQLLETCTTTTPTS